MTEKVNGMRYSLTLLDDKSISEKVLYGIDRSDDEIFIDKLSDINTDCPTLIKLTRGNSPCKIGKMYLDQEHNIVQVIETAVEVILLYKESSDVPASKILVFRKLI